jgi:hypothetical protein
VRAAALALAAAAPMVLAAEGAAITPFSAAAPGVPLPAPWRELALAHVKPPRFALVDDAGTTVLRVSSEAAAGAVGHALHIDASGHPALAWRWKIDRVVEHADLATKRGDDFAARVYVFFDVPAGEIPVGQRIALAFARWLYGPDVPSAALCYVWDNTHPMGTSVWSAYTRRVRVVVLESGNARAGQWVDERRDVEADYRAAFGTDGKAPPVSGVAAGNDTDQTGETVTAWFGDFRIAAGGAR